MSQRHLIECHCVLPVFKNKSPPLYHKFAVYSKIDRKTGKVIPKYTNCNNCGATHYVYELCRSDIKVGKEEIKSVRSIEEVSISFPQNLKNILTENNATIDLYEEVEDVLENDLYPREIILKREVLNENYHCKILIIKSDKKYKVLSETINTTVFKE